MQKNKCVTDSSTNIPGFKLKVLNEIEVNEAKMGLRQFLQQSFCLCIIDWGGRVGVGVQDVIKAGVIHRNGQNL